MKKVILIIFAVLAINQHRSIAQGVNFRKGITWDEALAKAKLQHKYIFVDCFATWCSPCRQMDKEVYPSKNVGDVYNSQFICIRLQMDKTSEDNDTVKRQYDSADMIKGYYAINAFPTFLFFDENGNPLHKSVGFRNALQFIQLAAEAKDSGKQYYHILKNFQPGKLDTADEEGLALSLANVDTTLAGDLGKDYLTRMASYRLHTKKAYTFMIELQGIPKVYEIIVQQVAKLTATDSIDPLGVEFMTDFMIKDRPEVQQLIMAYLRGLNDKQLAQPENISLIINEKMDVIKRQTNEAVAVIAKGYINRLPEDSLFTKTNIPLISAFMDLPTDRGFHEFYDQVQRIDAAMNKDGYAKGIIEGAISRVELDPKMTDAKQSGKMPDFELMNAEITKKYGNDYAARIIAYGKMAWYRFLVVTQKRPQYYPQFNSARIEQIELSHLDTVKDAGASINGICYEEFFKHCENNQELNEVAGFMKKVVGFNPQIPETIDTYAVLLYKSGKTNEGIEEEKRALEIANKAKYQRLISTFTYTIEKMKQGEKIWEDKKITGD